MWLFKKNKGLVHWVVAVYLDFLSKTLKINRAAGKGLDHPHSSLPIPHTHKTFRHIFAVLELRWLPRTFNLSTSNYEAVTLWDLSTIGY